MQEVTQAKQTGFLKDPTVRTIVSIIGFIGTLVVLYLSFLFMRGDNTPLWASTIVALVVGIGGIWVLYFSADNLVAQLPDNIMSVVRPLVFIGPAVFVLAAYLVFPAAYTVFLSLFGPGGEEFIGIENYLFRGSGGEIFGSQAFRISIRNNILWLILVTGLSVSLGLVIAVMVDRVKFESVAKSLIFLPLAISFVGASVIWRFVYYFRPAGRPQIGLLNAIKTALGGQPVAWITKAEAPIPLITDITNGLISLPLNTIGLIIIMIWLQTGFAMVVISAAVKGVPNELLEAARIDGANEVQIFFRVIIPYIRGTIMTVATTITILVLKVFDIVFVMTSGQFQTEVIANRMYEEMFLRRNFGLGSAYATILMIAVLPIMAYNIWQWREERKIR